MRRYYVCRPEVLEQLRKEIPEVRTGSGFLPSIELYSKPDQKQDVWEFSDHKEMRKYLNGELSELDLISLCKLN